MAYCSQCGTQIADDMKFCTGCGTPAVAVAAQRQQEYAGKIIKCPNCSEVLKPLDAICPACGHEINSKKVSESFRIFVDEIAECDRLIAESPVPLKKG